MSGREESGERNGLGTLLDRRAARTNRVKHRLQLQSHRRLVGLGLALGLGLDFHFGNRRDFNRLLRPNGNSISNFANANLETIFHHKDV